MAGDNLKDVVAAQVRTWAATALAAGQARPAKPDAWANALLYRHDTTLLGPAADRGRLLGGTIHTVRPGRAATGAESAEPITIFGADHGLLYAPGVGATAAATVFGYDDLIAFLRSNDVALASVCEQSFPNRYGAASAYSYESSVWGTAGVGERRSVPPVAVPHEHSGLGVLWAQGMVGAGRDITALAGLGYAPKECTVVRSPTGDYWLITTPTGGDWVATRLAIGGGLECAEAAVRAGEIVGLAADVMQALVLGRLVLADPAEVVTIAGWEADVAPLFAPPTGDFYWAGARTDIWQWGWQWAMQSVGAPDEFSPSAAIIVLAEVWLGPGQTDRRVCSREYTAVLEWDGGGMPTGVAFAAQADVLFALPRRIIELIGTSGQALPYGDATVGGPPIFGGGGPLAVWFKSDGSKAYVRWDGMARWEVGATTECEMPLVGYGAVSGVSRAGEVGGGGAALVDGVAYESHHPAAAVMLSERYAVARDEYFADQICTYYDEEFPVPVTWRREERGAWTLDVAETREVAAHLKTYLIFGAPRQVWVVSKEIAPRRSVTVTENSSGIGLGTEIIYDTPCTPAGLTPGTYPRDSSYVLRYSNYRSLTLGYALVADPPTPAVGTLIPGRSGAAYGPIPITVSSTRDGGFQSTTAGAVVCSYRGQWVGAVGSTIICPGSIPASALSGGAGWIWVGGA